MSLSGTKLAGSDPKLGRETNDYYATPFYATEAIINELEDLSLDDTILEPAAGEGHIVKVLKERFPYTNIIANDLIYRSSRFGIDVDGGIDFLTYTPYCKIDTVITNPPFKLAKEFIEKALTIANHYVIMFAKIQLLEGVDRRQLFEEYPPNYIYVFTKRVSPFINGEECNPNGKKWASTMCFAWFVWEKDNENEPIVRWL